MSIFRYFEGLFLHFINSIEVTVEAIEIEAASNDELVGYLMADVVRFGIVVLQFVRFEEQRRHAYGRSAVCTQVGLELVNREAGIDDILDDNDITLVYHLLKWHDELELAGGRHAVVRADTDEGNLTADIFQRAHEVRRIDKSTIQHYHKKRFFALIVRTDFFRHLLHVLRYLLRRKPFFEMITLFVNCPHSSEIKSRYTGSAARVSP